MSAFSFADPTLQQALALAGKVHAGVCALMGKGTYPSGEIGVARAMFAATIADGLCAIIVLVPSYGHAHGNTILRSMVEVLGDLYHSIADEGYLARLKLTSATKLKTSGELFIALRQGDPDASDMVQLTKEQCGYADEVVRTLSRSTKEIGPQQRVRAPGLPRVVEELYGRLCFDAHHDITALERRHIRDGRLLFGQTLTLADAIGMLSNATLIVQAAVSVLPKVGTFEHREYAATWQGIGDCVTALSTMLHEATAPARSYVRNVIASRPQ
jgi:hypothetical protein